MTPVDDLRRVAERDPARLALRSGDRRLTYDALAAAVESLAAELAEAGVRGADRVVIRLADPPSVVLTALAVRSLRAVVVPVDPSAGDAVLERTVEDARPSAIVADPARGAGGRRTIEVAGVGAVAVEPVASGSGPADTGPDPLAAVVYTSGTTGAPKGVMLTERNLEAVADAGRGLVGLGPEDRVGVVTPLHHLYGLREIDATIAAGAALVLPRQLAFVAAVLQQLHDARVTVLPAVPGMLAVAVRHYADDLARLGEDLRCLTMGSAAASPELLEAVARSLPQTRRFVTYGLTELSRACFREVATGDADVGSVGHPYPGVRVTVVGDDGDPLPVGSVGRVILRSEMVTPGYWRRPDLTAATLLEDGALVTPDLGRVDERGGLWLLGRADEVINTGGEKVGPDEVERVLRAHASVEDAAVRGVPDPTGIVGDVVKAWVVLAPRAQVTREALAAHCAARLEPAKVPREFAFVDELPRAQLGKVARRALGGTG